jgi:hypothetical protein
MATDVRALVEEDLLPGEQIQSFIKGRGLATDEVGGPHIGIAITAGRLMAVAKYTVRKTTFAWDLRDVTAVGIHQGLTKSKLLFTVPGDVFGAKGFKKDEAATFKREVDAAIHRVR